MSTFAGKPPTPHLPVEVWTKIIQYIPEDDCGSAWLGCRPLCRALKVATEFVFMKRHIPNLRVFLSPRLEVQDTDIPLYFLFERFSEDGERVMMEHPMPESEGWTQYLSDYLVEVVTILDRWANSPVDSEHIVQPGYISTLGRHARDTELPELEFNSHLQQLSFNWKRMLTTFFAEELFSNRLLAQHPVQAEIRNLPIPEPIWDPSLIVRLARIPARKLKDAKVEVEIRVRHMRVAKYRERHGNCDSVSDQPSDLFCQEAYDSLKEFRYTMGWGQELKRRSVRHRAARCEASTADDDAMDEGNESDDSMDQTRHWGQMDNFFGTLLWNVLSVRRYMPAQVIVMAGSQII